MRTLPWLAEPPVDFNQLCKVLADSENPVADVLSLTQSELSLNQCHRLYHVIGKSDRIKAELAAKLDHCTLGVVSNGTFDLVVPALVITALRRGLYLDVITSDFDQALQEAMDPGSTINLAKPNAVLVALDFRAFPFGANAWAVDTRKHNAANGLEILGQIRDGFHNNCGASCILQTLAMPPRSALGSIDGQLDGFLRREISEFNRQLTLSVASGADVLLDVDHLVGQVGSCHWFDERQWLMARIPMSNEYIPLYCEHIARIMAALRGKTKKCLVLDLDNTLWGGVIGDDGMDGIVLGQGNPVGEAHLSLQQYALELKTLGIVLAVCSKNDDAVARSVFRDHPDMLLREEDIAVFVANWEDKPGNIGEIARQLNIGLDALVFVDDNPAERSIVRSILPQVAVPELPGDPALVPRVVSAAGYFEAIDLSLDDALRAEQYAANSRREKAMQDAGGVEDFLRSLEMKMILSNFDKIGRKRITQLINKTNQFNLTTRRYTEAQVQQLEQSADHFTLQARLVDRFGDNGMISVVICNKRDTTWEIDSWLMSCRVIKRRVEEAICDELVRLAIDAGATTLMGVYRPSERNSLVSNHYESMGFKLHDRDKDGETWLLDLQSYVDRQPPIEVEFKGSLAGASA